MEMLRTLSLIAATITVGLTAGVFALYAHTIMPGLGRTDDRVFVSAFQAIDRAIINPWFLLGCFFGAPAWIALAAVLHLAEGQRSMLAWVLAALLLYAVAFVITIVINVPLNDAIKAAGDPDRIDLAAVRAGFNEAKWAGWNLVRVGTTLLAFAALAWALVLDGRAG